jgi:hypothetical protein
MATGDRFKLILDVRPSTAVRWLSRAKAVCSATKANAPLFASIATELDRLADDTEALDAAQASAANGGRDEVANRDAELETLKKSMRAVAAAVQGLCDDAPDAEHAAAIAAAAGFGGKAKAGYRKPDFYAKTLGSGRVQLFAKVPGYRGIRAYYEWIMSTDGGVTWVALPGTNDADTIVEGLPRATEAAFRHRTTVKSVTSAWSRTVAVIVE